MKTAAELKNVTLGVGGRDVLADISITIGSGEFVGVLGANGAGKTTLFRALLGLTRPTRGTIAVLGQPAGSNASRIGYLPQVRAAMPPSRLTGREILSASLNGSRWGLPWISSAQATEIDAVLDLVNARQLAARPFTDMSGGERQRLLIAQGLMGKPQLLLLDEPLIGLDPYQQQVVVDLVRDISRELNITVLFTAHELNQLLRGVDRILYLGRGQAALGTVEDVVQPHVLSRLYGAPIEVVRANGHVFVMSHGQNIERDHSHDPEKPHDCSGHPHVHGHHDHA